LRVFDDADIACRIPLWSAFAQHVSSSCYERTWHQKNAGCVGIRFLMEVMPLNWLLAHQLKFNKALLFCVMDLSEHIGMGVAADAKDIMVDLIKRCFGEGLDADVIRGDVTNDKTTAAAAAAEGAVPPTPTMSFPVRASCSLIYRSIVGHVLGCVVHHPHPPLPPSLRALPSAHRPPISRSHVLLHACNLTEPCTHLRGSLRRTRRRTALQTTTTTRWTRTRPARVPQHLAPPRESPPLRLTLMRRMGLRLRQAGVLRHARLRASLPSLSRFSLPRYASAALA